MCIKASSDVSSELLSLPSSCQGFHTGQVLDRCKCKHDHSRHQPAYLSKWFDTHQCSAADLVLHSFCLQPLLLLQALEEAPSNTTLLSQFILNYVNKCIYFYKIGIILHCLLHSTIPFTAHTSVNC